MNTIKTIFTAILVLFALTTGCAQSKDKFTGTYKAIDETGNALEQNIEIFYKDDTYYFQAEGAEAYKAALSEDGKELKIQSEDGGKINDDGSVEINLGAELRLFYENNQLIYEMTIPDLGTDRYVLQKL